MAIDHRRCVGCGKCVKACPYGAARKCHFCAKVKEACKVQILKEALGLALAEPHGSRGSATTASRPARGSRGPGGDPGRSARR